jgi:hypothetical protein
LVLATIYVILEPANVFATKERKMPRIEIDIYPWPTRDTENPLGLQGNIYVDGKDVCGFTGPGNNAALFYQAVDLLSENWSYWVSND